MYALDNQGPLSMLETRYPNGRGATRSLIAPKDKNMGDMMGRKETDRQAKEYARNGRYGKRSSTEHKDTNSPKNQKKSSRQKETDSFKDPSNLLHNDSS